jgi:DNA polymerase-4
MEVYVAVALQVRAVFERYTDLVEPLSLDEAFLDVTGSERLFGCGSAIAGRIKHDVRQATQLTVSVGVAASKYVAKVASDLRKPDGLVVVEPGQERAFLAPLPVSRLWGVGPKTQEVMRAHGLTTIGDLQRMTEAQLAAAFGANAAGHFWQLASGIDPRAVEPEREAKSIGHELTFAEDLRTRAQVEEILLQLAEQVGRRLRQHGLCGSVVRLKLRHGDFTTMTRQRQIEPSQDGLVLFRTARELCEQCWPGQPGIRLLGVTAAGLRPAASLVQSLLFAEAPGKAGKVLRAMDAIKDRFGEDAIRRGAPGRRGTPWGPLRD